MHIYNIYMCITMTAMAVIVMHEEIRDKIDKMK